MSKVEVVYSGLIRTAAACTTDIYEVAPDATVHDLFKEIIRRHGDAVRRYLFSDDCLKLAPGAAVFKDGYSIRNLNTTLSDQQKIKVVVLSPMMIGG